MSEELDLAHRVARAVQDAGGRAFIVGGWVRDDLLDRASCGGASVSRPSKDAARKDIDIEVFDLPADRLQAVLAGLGQVNSVGASFAVFKLGPLDISLPRTESKAGRGHRGFVVTGDPYLPLEEAARRRDFTVNAIAWDPLRGEHLDPHGGREDLRRRRLRMVDPATFGDDSLRVLRAVQLAARLEFEIDEPTRALCRTIALDDLPAERVWGEMEKLLLCARQPSRGFALARDIGVVDRLFPELAALVDCPQEPEWHPEGDVWTHTLLVIDEARRRGVVGLSRPRQIAVMLGAVCHDFGKPATTAHIDGRIRSLNHEEMGVPPATAFLDRLNIHTFDGYDVRGQVLGLVAHHLKPGMWRAAPKVGDGAFRRLARKVDLELLARLARADCEGRRGDFDCSAMAWFLDRARSLGVEHEPPAPILMGRHVLALGVPPGPGVGSILKQVYERQLDGGITTLEEATAAARALLEARRG
ncbi:MAG: polynucleotide adenylyltransferase [Acidobacteria bacterium]|nr:polynucleotide adenylyltransferase [Acidobacteriota bacterium]MYK86961.1 polynucleotide adenylyltransferase [Acidobacteriota bacterium]